MAAAAQGYSVGRAGVERAVGAEFPRLARRLFGNVRLDFSGAEKRENRLVSVALGPCRLSQLSAGRHMVHGDRVTEGDAPDMVKLIIQTKGHSWLQQAGRKLPVGPSSVVLYDPASPYILANPEAVDLLMLQVPRACIPQDRLRRASHPVAASLVPGSLHRVLFSMMQSTVQEIELLDEAERSRLGQSMMELVRGMLAANSSTPPGSRSLELLNERIKDYIAANLSRPELGAPEIALRVGCSLRYVYRALEAEGMTPAEYIWSERLARAADLLGRQSAVQGSIGEIAFGLGFSSSAHFSRAFRARYELSPTEWSRLARA